MDLTDEQVDAEIAATAEAHRVEYQHEVYVRKGEGWMCWVCDAIDIEDWIYNG